MTSRHLCIQPILTNLEQQPGYADQMGRDKTGQLHCHERVGISLSGMPSAQTRLLHLKYLCAAAKQQACAVADQQAKQIKYAELSATSHSWNGGTSILP